MIVEASGRQIKIRQKRKTETPDASKQGAPAASKSSKMYDTQSVRE